MNDLFEDPFSAITGSHKSDQASVNLEQEDLSSKKSEPLPKKRERGQKRKALQFDSEISLSNDEIAELQHGTVKGFSHQRMDIISWEWCLEQVQEPPICKIFSD